MANTLKQLTIEGYKSIQSLKDFELRPLNVLIGSNGAGKSNFVSFFRFLHELIHQRLQTTVRQEGGADSFLHLGPKETPQLGGKLYFGNNGYEFTLVPSIDGRFIFAKEQTYFRGDQGPIHTSLGYSHFEANLKDQKDDPGRRGGQKGVPHYVFEAISNWVVYHFHDTSFNAGVRRLHAINDDLSLRFNAENLAPFLYRIFRTSPESYARIREVVRLAAPFFDDFALRPDPTNEGMIQLEWHQRGSDYPFRGHQLSDGTLRFICLATALLQPEPPPTMLFDEPELGLHPYALTLLGNLFRQITSGPFPDHQAIISTQSAQLLNEFRPEDIIVVERSDGHSQFRRLRSEDLSEWLQDYSMGELWQKNVLGARPGDEHAPRFALNGGDGKL
ncbi:MAG: AAA family ATPase [Bryobacteraceae bacterium]